MKTFIWFGTEPDSWARPRGGEGRGRVRERKDGREQADRGLWARGSEWEWTRGRGATTCESFKPVIAVGDAERDWGFLQHVEAKQIPLHGLLQSERFRFCRGGRACFFVLLLFGEGGNIKRWDTGDFEHMSPRGLPRLKCTGLQAAWFSERKNIASAFMKVKTQTLGGSTRTLNLGWISPQGASKRLSAMISYIVLLSFRIFIFIKMWCRNVTNI